ncbi:MAG: alpha-ketoglutarate-dependent dioxygenase AlkB [Thiobacillus sp.]|uniref:alpha-ketoglutarate-dependent dioxygenase AlkB n=1 Tax=Thiobacillus sp. TaxID=924 RepID=UPI002735F903|nr:alpha-ketoglutarate-dependent dioxygenase AlkB [Thiobacillus sp.]MDP3584279.1 alpha-ketoglutarate-dependent dioxygenase AlkB [Thiobacillus sp.]
MTAQFELFNAVETPRPEPEYPEGFRYQPELLGAADEAALLARVRELPFRAFEFHGYTGKRRVVSFGWQYDFSGRQLREAAPIPDFLRDLRATAAAFAAVAPEALQQILVTEYSPGAGIGWHRDKPVYGQVVGISLLAPCVFRFRRATGDSWARINLTAAPRSAYLLNGLARTLWEHSIPPVNALRYSITFRTLREG